MKVIRSHLYVLIYEHFFCYQFQLSFKIVTYETNVLKIALYKSSPLFLPYPMKYLLLFLVMTFSLYFR